MNLNLYGLGPKGQERWVMVDCGVTFGGPNEPGIDLITPDITFIKQQRERLLALVLTHAHEDHIGAIGMLWEELQCPIYATPFTALMVEAKLRERGLPTSQVHRIKTGQTIRIGDFDIRYMAITHSIPESHLLGITTPLGAVVHTGDWKFDPDPVIGSVSDLDGFGDFAEKNNILAMVCDSTNAITPGRSGSERAVADELKDVVAGIKGRAIVTTFASNAARVKAIFQAAQANQREIVLVGRSMHKIVDAARGCGYLAGLPSPVPEEDAGFLPPEHTLILCTGSQGEGRAALGKMADGTHPFISLSSRDTVIFSSKIIPGNEKTVFGLFNRLSAKGVRIITEKHANIHVSGHPCAEELSDMYKIIQPKLAIPVHGEVMHMMTHASIAYEANVPAALVPSNGMMIELAPNLGEVLEHVDAGRLYVDGYLMERAGESAADDRRRLTFAGCVFVCIVYDERAVESFYLTGRGVPQALLDDHHDGFYQAVVAVLSNFDNKLPSASVIGEHVRQAIRRQFKSLWGKKPLVDVHMLEKKELFP